MHHSVDRNVHIVVRLFLPEVVWLMIYCAQAWRHQNDLQTPRLYLNGRNLPKYALGNYTEQHNVSGRFLFSVLG